MPRKVRHHMPYGPHGKLEALESQRQRREMEALRQRITVLESDRDRAQLLEEVERLRREVERLHGIIYRTPPR